jgi:hypothetical protein
VVEGIVLAELLRRSQFDLNQRIQFYNVAYKAVVKSQQRKMLEFSSAVRIIHSLRCVSCHGRTETGHAQFAGRISEVQWCAYPGCLDSGETVVGNSL